MGKIEDADHGTITRDLTGIDSKPELTVGSMDHEFRMECRLSRPKQGFKHICATIASRFLKV